ncbi:hypothetical protein [Flavobacterium sp.]|uniref:hypothetical protein n=1 Tax=Flavobacterium sp. TaxID=239 RepID=UPI002D0ADFF9|nr:hypothetical protein [Flavobacterium sp.]HSD08603.1 hypothetical protein [Flavobacterium sp.]
MEQTISTGNNFELISLSYQVFSILLFVVIGFVVIRTIRKIWKLLDEAIQYLENKNDAYNNE